MFRKASSGVKIKTGDRFIKSDDPSIVWVVAGEGSSVSPIPHYQVVQEGRKTRRRTLSEQTLLDRDYYQRLD